MKSKSRFSGLRNTSNDEFGDLSVSFAVRGFAHPIIMKRRIRLHCWTDLSFRVIVVFLTLSLLFPLFAKSQQENRESQKGGTHSVGAQMQNVIYHFTDSISVHISTLKGRLLAKSQIPVFDDKQSFVLEIDAANISMSTAALEHVLNEYVFAGSNAPLKDLKVSTQGDRLVIKGRLPQKGSVSFEMVGGAQPTSDGRIRIHTEKLKAAHLPVKKLMDLFGVEIADLINAKKVKGVATEKDDIILDPQQILPPPQLRARVTNITVKDGEIVQVFGNPEKSGTTVPPDLKGRNFMAYRGATLRFGKLTMDDTDLQLIDEN